MIAKFVFSVSFFFVLSISTFVSAGSYQPKDYFLKNGVFGWNEQGKVITEARIPNAEQIENLKAEYLAWAAEQMPVLRKTEEYANQVIEEIDQLALRKKKEIGENLFSGVYGSLAKRLRESLAENRDRKSFTQNLEFAYRQMGEKSDFFKFLDEIERLVLENENPRVRDNEYVDFLTGHKGFKYLDTFRKIGFFLRAGEEEHMKDLLRLGDDKESPFQPWKYLAKKNRGKNCRKEIFKNLIDSFSFIRPYGDLDPIADAGFVEFLLAGGKDNSILKIKCNDIGRKRQEKTKYSSRKHEVTIPYMSKITGIFTKSGPRIELDLVDRPIRVLRESVR